MAETPSAPAPRPIIPAGTTLASRVAFVFCVLAVAAAGLWWVTEGAVAGRITEPFAFGDVFDAQAQSFVHARLNVDCDVLSGEAFIVDGKCYLYFGPFPSLLRIPILASLPRLFGRLTRLTVWFANLLLLSFLLMILAEAGFPAGSWTSSAFLLLACFGSTIPLMWGWPTAYVEAISWAAAFAVGTIAFLLRWSRTGEIAWLVAACAAAGLSLLSRANTGVGPMAATGVCALMVWRRGGKSRVPAARVLVALAVFAGTYMMYNYLRFGTLADGMPVRYHIQYYQPRLAKIGGTVVHPSQAPFILFDYLVYPPRLRASYPWLEQRTNTAIDVGPLDLLDFHTGALPLMPGLVFLAWGGWRAVRARRERWILLAPVPGLIALTSVVCITQRYIHEFIVLFAPLAAFGLPWVAQGRVRKAAALVLAAWSIYTCWALGLVQQREKLPWIDEAARARHRATRIEIDNRLGLSK